MANAPVCDPSAPPRAAAARRSSGPTWSRCSGARWTASRCYPQPGEGGSCGGGGGRAGAVQGQIYDGLCLSLVHHITKPEMPHVADRSVRARRCCFRVRIGASRRAHLPPLRRRGLRCPPTCLPYTLAPVVPSPPVPLLCLPLALVPCPCLCLCHTLTPRRGLVSHPTNPTHRTQ